MPMTEFLEEELNHQNFADLDLEFCPQLNGLYIQGIEFLKTFQKFKDNQVYKLKKAMLQKVVEDIMIDY